jgi:hypothetical protein
MAYERNINLMDESLFPRDSIYTQKRNLKKFITTDVRRIEQEQTDDEIIDFVTKEMSDAFRDVRDS